MYIDSPMNCIVWITEEVNIGLYTHTLCIKSAYKGFHKKEQLKPSVQKIHTLDDAYLIFKLYI